MRRDLIVVPLASTSPDKQPVYTDELACLVRAATPICGTGRCPGRPAGHAIAVAHFLSAGDRQRPLEREMARSVLQDRTVLVQVTTC